MATISTIISTFLYIPILTPGKRYGNNTTELTEIELCFVHCGPQYPILAIKRACLSQYILLIALNFKYN